MSLRSQNYLKQRIFVYFIKEKCVTKFANCPFVIRKSVNRFTIIKKSLDDIDWLLNASLKSKAFL